VALTLGLQERVEQIVVCSYRGDAFRPQLEEAGVPIELIPRPRPDPRAVLRSALALAPILRRESPDVVHAHNPGAAAAAALARRLARRPDIAVVASFHGVDPGRMGRAARVLARSADLVVAIAGPPADDLRLAGLSGSRVVVVHNGIETGSRKAAEDVRRELDLEDAELVVSVGRYAEEKNQVLLLDALARLVPSRPRLRGLLIGTGPLKAELGERIRQLELEAEVELTGTRLDAVDVVAAADVFVLPSDREGLPVALLEAMGVGCPVVATAVGGVPGVVEDGESGLLVPPGDAAALAAAIERLLDDPQLRARLAEKAREKVEREFSERAMVQGYEEAYLSAVEARRRR
jgi:glycosyltransferase involved in cell wall biosynthesis